MREPEHFFSQLTSSSAMAHSFTDWRQYYNLPTGHAGSPFSDFSQNQAYDIIGPRARDPIDKLGETSTSSVSPANLITNGIPVAQLQALAQGLHTLSSQRPTEPAAPEENP